MNLPAVIHRPTLEYAWPRSRETLSLRLSANTSGTIYYTLDGSEPDENSLTYASPIFLESGAYRIRAVFVNQYGVSSEEAEGNYYVDVTVPEAPQVSPEEGSYSRPTLITVTGGENCKIYYTTDGTTPTQDKTEYTGPFPMPVGVTKFRFICYSLAGAAGEETQVTYSLNLHASLSIEAARNRLLIELMAADVIQDMDGTVETGTGHYVYNYRCAVTIDGVDYYLYREYYEDDAGNSAATGTDYVVDIMNGTCYKALQTVQAEADAAADSRKGGGSADHLIGGLHIPFLHLLDEAGNVDGYGTALHTLCVFAVNASGSLFHRFFSVISQADLLKIGRSDLSILFPDGYLF